MRGKSECYTFHFALNEKPFGQFFERHEADRDSLGQPNPLGKFVASPVPRHFERAHPVADFFSQVHSPMRIITLTEHIYKSLCTFSSLRIHC